MVAELLVKQRAWVSLPIIALLLAMSSLSMHFQETLLANYQWRGQLHDVDAELHIWTHFQQTVVMSPSFGTAVDSQCVGFCELGRLAQQHAWQKDNQFLYYRWERYKPMGEEEATPTSYRLCATQNQQEYRCWWWRGDRRLSDGWVSASG